MADRSADAGRPEDVGRAGDIRPRSGPTGDGRGHPNRTREVRRRGWAEVRWRQFRNAPRPVVRAVLSPLAVAIVLGTLYLAYDVALLRGAQLPGGDLRVLAGALYVLGVVIAGAFVTWLVVPLPTGAGRAVTRTPWSAALGLFAAVPVAYLVLVVALEIVRPLLV